MAFFSSPLWLAWPQLLPPKPVLAAAMEPPMCLSVHQRCLILNVLEASLHCSESGRSEQFTPANLTMGLKLVTEEVAYVVVLLHLRAIFRQDEFTDLSKGI